MVWWFELLDNLLNDDRGFHKRMNITVIREGAGLIKSKRKGLARSQVSGIKNTAVAGHSVCRRVIIRPGYSGTDFDR